MVKEVSFVPLLRLGQFYSHYDTIETDYMHASRR